MARRRTKRRGGYQRTGAYRYTPKRAVALKRAQEISARKRRRKRNIKRAAYATGAIAGVSVTAYAGHRYGGVTVAAVRNHKPKMANVRNRMAARLAVDPDIKEIGRAKNNYASRFASRKGQTPKHIEVPQISAADQAALTEKVERDKMQPHMGGPDYRVYDPETHEVQTEKMTNRRVRQQLRRWRKGQKGKKSKSHKGTPGGTTTPKNARMRSAKITQQDKDKALEQWVKDMDSGPSHPVTPPTVAGRRTPSKITPGKKAPGKKGAPAKKTPAKKPGKNAKPKLTGVDKEAAINAAMNANPFLTREEVMKKLGLA